MDDLTLDKLKGIYDATTDIALKKDIANKIDIINNNNTILK